MSKEHTDPERESWGEIERSVPLLFLLIQRRRYRCIHYNKVLQQQILLPCIGVAVMDLEIQYLCAHLPVQC